MKRHLIMIKILKKETNEVLLEADNSRITPDSIVFYDEFNNVIGNITNGVFNYSTHTLSGVENFIVLEDDIKLEFVNAN